jgi:hypothetical protein
MEGAKWAICLGFARDQAPAGTVFIIWSTTMLQKEIAFQGQDIEDTGIIRWCGRWDSNPHDVAIEGF